MKKVYILTMLLFMGQPSWAQIRDFQTTRLNSTAGTGVASVLSTEAALLNPAVSAFFSGNTSSYQHQSTSIRNESDDRKANNDDFAKNNKSQGAFLADHDGPIKGGLGWVNQNENDYKRERLIAHAAAPMGPNAAVGISYNYLRDKRPSELSPRHAVNHEVVLGVSHIIDEKTLLGLVVVDPGQTLKDQDRVIAGFQYAIAERFVLLGDAGMQYTKSVSKKHLWRAAVQINVFSDFFLRAGKFYDKASNFQGTGWGASWIGPRFGVEFAQKISEQFGEDAYIYKKEKLIDTSISAIIKF
jgi:hypothetical protein